MLLNLTIQEQCTDIEDKITSFIEKFNSKSKLLQLYVHKRLRNYIFNKIPEVFYKAWQNR